MHDTVETAHNKTSDSENTKHAWGGRGRKANQVNQSTNMVSPQPDGRNVTERLKQLEPT